MTDSITIPILTKVIGGIIPGRAYYFHGETGCGKTILGLQMAQAWARAGKTSLYLTDENPDDLAEHADSLGLNLRDHLDSRRILIARYLDLAPTQIESLGSAGFLHRLGEIKTDSPINAIIFDPINRLVQNLKQKERQGAVVESLLDGLSRKGWNSVFLAENQQLKRQPGVAEKLKDRCWATVAMGPEPDPFSFWKWWRRAKQEETFSLRVEKSRQPTPSGHRIPYQIVPDAGLIPAWEAVGGSDSAVQSKALVQKPRILLATGEKNLLEPLESLLSGSVVTKTVSSGVEALSQAVTWHPQVVVAEIDLPELSGLSVTRALRQGRYTMPVILITRKKRLQSERIRAFLNGATDFVHFPLDPIELAYRIRVASRMRLSSFPDGTEEQMLEVLLKRAKSHVLDRPTFLQALSLSLINSKTLSSPNSLAIFRIRAGSEDGGQESIWQVFQEILDRHTRSGDLITYPDERSAVVLLGHELNSGASMFLDRLSKRLEQENFGRFSEHRDWCIESMTRTIELSEEGALDPDELLRIEIDEMETFYASGMIEADVEKQRDSAKRRKRA